MNVYRLITNRTYEMEMFQRANLKLGLDKAVLNPLKQSIRSDGSTDMAVGAACAWRASRQGTGVRRRR